MFLHTYNYLNLKHFQAWLNSNADQHFLCFDVFSWVIREVSTIYSLSEWYELFNLRFRSFLVESRAEALIASAENPG